MKLINYFFNRSLKTKIVSQVLIVLLLIQGLMIVSGGYAWFNWEKGELDEQIRNKARLFISLARDVDGKLEFSYAARSMPEFSSKKNKDIDPSYFRLFKGNQLIQASRTLDSLDYVIDEQSSKMNRFYDVAFSNGEQGRLYRKTFYPATYDLEGNKISNRSPYQLTIEVATGVQNLEKKKIFLVTFLLVCFYLLVFFTAVAVYKIVSKGLKQLTNLQEEISQFDGIDSDQQFIEDQSAPDEVKEISKQFNIFLAKLRVSFLREKNLSANLAHELRTPIAEITTLSEVAIDSHNKSGKLIDLYPDILESAHYLQSVTNSLIAISRNEKVTFSDDIALIDLQKRINICLDRFSEGFQEKSLRVKTDFCEQTVVASNEYAIDLIVNNLLQNIVQYADPNSEVDICFYQKTDQIYSLLIKNSCDELEKDDVEFVFDRLWRKNKYRTRGKNAGLGLSLVKSYVGILGLSISVDLQDGLFIMEISGFSESLVNPNNIDVSKQNNFK